MITFTEEQVEALARVLYEEARSLDYAPVPWADATEAERTYFRDIARAALSSDVIGDLIAEALRVEANRIQAHANEHDRIVGEEIVGEGDAFSTGLRAAERRLRDRAAALSPTPADGTTSERSEA